MRGGKCVVTALVHILQKIRTAQMKARTLHNILHTGDDGNLLDSLKQDTFCYYVDCTSKVLRERETSRSEIILRDEIIMNMYTWELYMNIK